MIKFGKAVKLTEKGIQVHTKLLICGSRAEVLNAIQNLSFIFRGRRVCAISKKEMAEAAKAIKAVITVKNRAQNRRGT